MLNRINEYTVDIKDCWAFCPELKYKAFLANIDSYQSKCLTLMKCRHESMSRLMKPLEWSLE